MVYFGTIEGPLAQMQEIPCMVVPMGAAHTGYVAQQQFENGGTGIVRSMDSHKSYALSFQGFINDSQSVDVVMEYYNGEYGDGYLYMVDPALVAQGANLFRRNWATPAIIGDPQTPNYKPLHPGYLGTIAVTGDYGAPALAAQFAHIAGKQGRFFTLPIPDGYTLWVGARASRNSANIAIKAYLDGVYDTDITLSTIGGDQLYTESFSGPSVVRIRIESTGGSTLTLQSMDAILVPTGQTPQLTGDHQRGQGVSGMKFNSDSIPYEYRNAERGIRSFSVELTEVEEWAHADSL